MAEVIHIPPKSDTLRHRRVEYRLTYVPDTREWEWVFTVTYSSTLSGREPSYAEALTSAKTHIDLATGG